MSLNCDSRDGLYEPPYSPFSHGEKGEVPPHSPSPSMGEGQGEGEEEKV